VASDGLDTTYNPNGSVGPEDLDAFTAAFIAGNVAMADVATDSLDVSRNPNGSVGADDQNSFIAAYIAGTGTTVKRGVLESGGIDSGLGGNRFGYAGYELDPALHGPETVTVGGVPVTVLTQTMYHVRHRVYDAENGRWTRRDPLGYVDGMGLYEYCGSGPKESLDSHGLACQPSSWLDDVFFDIRDGIRGFFQDYCLFIAMFDQDVIRLKQLLKDNKCKTPTIAFCPTGGNRGTQRLNKICLSRDPRIHSGSPFKCSSIIETNRHELTHAVDSCYGMPFAGAPSGSDPEDPIGGQIRALHFSLCKEIRACMASGVCKSGGSLFNPTSESKKSCCINRAIKYYLKGEPRE